MTKRTPARRIGSVLCCIIALLLAAGCETPVGVERLDASTAQRRLTANVLTTDELSPQARNVLRRWVLAERYDYRHPARGSIVEIPVDGGVPQTVGISEPHHLSYPYTFADGGRTYCVPEAAHSGSCRLYTLDGDGSFRAGPVLLE